MRVHRLSQSLRLLVRPSFIFGAVIITTCWISFAIQLSVERSKALDAAIERGNGSARLFEETTIRLIRGVDQKLLLLRQAYEERPEQFNLPYWAERASLVSDVTTQVGVIDSDGYMRARTEYTGPPLDLRDREHFQVHVDAKADQLFISKPIILRATGNSSIQITRRLRKPDGSFGGVIVASVNPVFAEQFYRSVKLGADSSVSLRGLDGAVRASYGLSVPIDFNEKMPKGLSDMLPLAPEGYFWGEGKTDGINRLSRIGLLPGILCSSDWRDREPHLR